ncbi:MAG TPA: LamG-like jellyroll fold domain-containing protein [Verrucomicrobiae bacterium]
MRRAAVGLSVGIAAAITAFAQQDVTQPGDVVFASSANSPPSEGVANAIDNKTTKYLNFDSGRDGNTIGNFSPSGFTVTPGVGLTRVTGISLQSANDAQDRDPDVIIIEGSNGSVTNYSGGTWEAIATISNAAAGFTNRFQTQVFTFDNEKPYKSYRIIFDRVRNIANGCCMQVAEVELLGTVVPQDVTQPGDVIFASSANSPPSEGVANAIDNKTTKYLNFDSGRDGNQIGNFSPSGFAVSPAIGRTLISGITMQSANDAQDRDPEVVLIEGSNDTNLTSYAAGNWTQITTLSNVAAGFTARFQEQTFLFDNVQPYNHYRVTFQRVRNIANGCCMQVAEVQLLGTSAPQDITQPGDLIFASSANSPPSEGVANAIDNKTTKYLNFDSGRDGNQIGNFSPSGFAVQPAIGATRIIGMALQSANDAQDRDPEVVLIEGSNDTNLTSYASGTWTPITTISNIAAGFTNRFQRQEFYFENEVSYRNYRWTAQRVRNIANGCCMQVAEVELLAVTVGAPASARFLSQPSDTPTLLGQSATFYTTLNGPWPVQWYKNEVLIPGATRTSYTTEPVTAENQTNVYTVQIVGRETSVPVRAIVFTPSATDSIGINFIGGGANGAPTDVNTNLVIGVWPQAYWNNAGGASGDLPTTDIDGNLIPVLQSDGTESTITVNYLANGTWGAGTGVDTPTERLLNGNMGADEVGDEPNTITFGNVPAGNHSVLIYVVSPPLQVQNVSYNIGSTTYYVRAMNSDEYNAAPGFYRGSSTDANNPTVASFVRFDNVQPDGNGQIVLTFDTLTTANEATGVNAIQLVLNAPAVGAPPTITQQPASTVAAAGGTARLSVVATGSSLTYQWRKNGRNLSNGGNVSGATSPNLTISNFGDTDVAVYNVAVFSPAGSVVSRNASVNLSTFQVTEGASVYLPLNETAGTTADNAVGTDGTVNGTATWGAGKIANAFTFDGSTYITVPNFTKPTRFMGVSAWVNADPSTAATVSFIRNAVGGLSTAGTNSGLFDLGLVLDDTTGLVHLRGQVAVGPAVLEVIDPNPFTVGQWQHVALSVDGAQIRLFKNGTEVASRDYTFDLLNTPAVQFLTLGGGIVYDEFGTQSLDPANAFIGRLDDVALATRNLTTEEVGKIFTQGNLGQPITSVQLTQPQQDITVDIEQSGNNLTITWDGPGRLQSSATVDGTYADVQGATGTSYTTTATGPMRFYQVVR